LSLWKSDLQVYGTQRMLQRFDYLTECDLSLNCFNSRVFVLFSHFFHHWLFVLNCRFKQHMPRLPVPPETAQTHVSSDQGAGPDPISGSHRECGENLKASGQFTSGQRSFMRTRNLTNELITASNSFLFVLEPRSVRAFPDPLGNYFQMLRDTLKTLQHYWNLWTCTDLSLHQCALWSFALGS